MVVFGACPELLFGRPSMSKIRDLSDWHLLLGRSPTCPENRLSAGPATRFPPNPPGSAYEPHPVVAHWQMVGATAAKCPK